MPDDVMISDLSMPAAEGKTQLMSETFAQSQTVASPMPFEKPTNEPTCLLRLPSVIVARILSFLPWKEKLEVIKFLPEWTDELSSPDAWSFFENTYTSIADRGQIFLWHQELCLCIEKYGRYFQHCKIVLNYYDVYDNGLHLLEAVAENCCNLKTVDLHHPVCFGFNLVEVLHQYVDILNSIVTKNRSLRSVSLFGLDYLALDRSAGINELFMELSECDSTVVKKVRILEFSHAYDFSQPVTTLCCFDNLCFLKSEIHSLNTGIILKLCSRRLKTLHLLSNGATLNEEFKENDSINWKEIASSHPKLNVHYIFQGRSLHARDIVLNDLVRCVVLDSMCNRVTLELLEALARNYGRNLCTFAHLATEWSFMPYDDDLNQLEAFLSLLSHCPVLETFITQVTISSSALLEMAETKRLKEIAVVETEIAFDIDYAEDPEMYFQVRMEKLMGNRLKMLSNDSFSSYTLYLHKAGAGV